MHHHERSELGKKAAAWLATCFVLAGGLMTCVFLAIVFLERPVLPLVYLAAGGAAMGLLMWLLRDRGPRPAPLGLFAWVLRGRNSAHPVTAVRVRRKKSDAPVEYGTNTPPSVEVVRDLADGIHRWVPSDKPRDAAGEP